MTTSKDNPTTETETKSAEPASVKKTTSKKAAAKPEVVAEAPPVETKEVDTTIAEATDATPVEVDPTTAEDIKPARGGKPLPKRSYEFLEELPNKQQAAPVVAKAESNPDPRITAAIDGDETEPKKVEADKAFDLETQQTPAIDGRPEPEPAPAEVDQPEIDGVSTTTDTQVTAYIEEGETEPKPVKHEDTFAEGTSKTLEPNPGRVGGEGPRYDPEVYNAASSEEKKPAKSRKAAKGDGDDKPKTDNPKLQRLSKYRS